MTQGRYGDWMLTYTGRQFWPIDPRPEDIDIRDIAHALAHQCRYAGHCTRFYSVAEHCVHVAAAVPKHALWALLHDASEAYLVDVPRPVKPFLSGYHQFEVQLMSAVAEKFGLQGDMPAEVIEADTRILNDERQQIMTDSPHPWSGDKRPLGIFIRGYEPKIAEMLFMDAFHAFSAPVGKLIPAQRYES